MVSEHIKEEQICSDIAIESSHTDRGISWVGCYCIAFVTAPGKYDDPRSYSTNYLSSVTKHLVPAS